MGSVVCPQGPLWGERHVCLCLSSKGHIRNSKKQETTPVVHTLQRTTHGFPSYEIQRNYSGLALRRGIPVALPESNWNTICGTWVKKRQRPRVTVLASGQSSPGSPARCQRVQDWQWQSEDTRQGKPVLASRETGETAPQLSTLTTLAGDADLVLRTHMVAHNCPQVQFQGCKTLS